MRRAQPELVELERSGTTPLCLDQTHLEPGNRFAPNVHSPTVWATEDLATEDRGAGRPD